MSTKINTITDEAASSYADSNATLTIGKSVLRDPSISSTNCVSSTSWLTSPYYQIPLPTIYEYQIRRVENGLVIVHNSKEYVFTTINQLLKFLESSLEEKKKK